MEISDFVKFVMAWEAWVKAGEDCNKAREAWDEARKVRSKTWDKAWKAYDRAQKEWSRAWETCQKALTSRSNEESCLIPLRPPN